ncbi:MAG: TonB-dependent receptor [Candidatus Zixiibacteriota bacterium]
MQRFTLIIALVAILSGSAIAGELAGKVTDKSGAPLMGVSVVTDIAGLGTQTDTAGEFLLRIPEASGGSVTQAVTRVTFSSVGYQSVQYHLVEVPKVIALTPIFYPGTDILVTADRGAKGSTPIAFEDFSRDAIKRDYQVGEFPLLLESTPNLYSYSDGGGALGYSYMSIRGFDDKRISTYINGVPLNDPEDQATYFVDLPDFASTVTDIQVQRGVGNSLYGDASFGGSVNIVTNAFARERQVKLTSGWGEFRADGKKAGELAKQSLEYTSGLIDGRWNFTGRFSKQKSGGYRENSWYDGWAYYFSVARLDPRSMTEVHLYGGPMRMHLAYYGATLDDIATDRRINYLGYDNETDNFNQPHYQLHNIYQLSDKATLSNTLYYIRGKGYYEQLKSDANYREYAIDTSQFPSGDSTGNVVRQQWVEKSQWGWNPRLDIEHAKGKHSLGGSFYYFDSDHWGQVVWAQNISGQLDPRHRYYQYNGKKWVGSFYAMESYQLTPRLSGQVTAQMRYQRYSFDQDRMGAFHGFNYDVHWLNFSPRAGLNYVVDSSTSLFANLAVSTRTPTDAEIYDAGDPELFPSLEVKSTTISGNDTSYVFGQPTGKSERVLNLELGVRHRARNYSLGANLFWMDFRHEILPYGGINPNTGIAITVNAERSVQSGLELTGDLIPVEHLKLSANWAFNYNRVKKFSAEFADTGTVVQSVDFAKKTISGFPNYLGNLIADFDNQTLRITGRVRFVGKQFMELYNIDSLAIKPRATVSLTGSYAIGSISGLGRLRLSVTVENLLNKKYLSSGYGGNYVYEGQVYGWAEYFVAAERNFFGQLELEFF